MPPLCYIYKYPYKILWHLINFIGLLNILSIFPKPFEDVQF